ncbi:hypothetical protein BJ165DRAFT_74575 [Panaeolus papilionaceus]|nr:hypothetical protein BJ165DRAFT_74575 [Panaeolus papilionaceus]
MDTFYSITFSHSPSPHKHDLKLHARPTCGVHSTPSQLQTITLNFRLTWRQGCMFLVWHRSLTLLVDRSRAPLSLRTLAILAKIFTANLFCNTTSGGRSPWLLVFVWPLHIFYSPSTFLLVYDPRDAQHVQAMSAAPISKHDRYAFVLCLFSPSLSFS